jgi:hypothetical protein
VKQRSWYGCRFNRIGHVSADDLEAAWGEVHDATPPDWYVGRPSYHDERHEWTMYAFDQRERHRAGVKSREWTAVAETEVEVLARDGAMPSGDRRRSGAAVALDGGTKALSRR